MQFLLMVGPFAEALAKNPVEDLACAGTRHFFILDEVNILRDLETCDLALAPCGYVIRLQLFAFMENDDCRYLFAPFLVGYADDGNILDVRVSADTVLDF